MPKITYYEWFEMVKDNYKNYICSNNEIINKIIKSNVRKNYYPDKNKLIHMIAFTFYISDQMQ